MNILLINGSPKGKRSNTYKLSKSFIEGITQSASAVCEELIVKDMEIRPCRGCFACWNKTPGECVIKDDMKHVIDKILAADVIIWSFGLYCYNVPSILKSLIDRRLPLSLPFMVKSSKTGDHPQRYDMSNKRHVVISTCGFYTATGNYDSVNAMFDHSLGKDGYEKIYCGQGELFQVPELKDKTDAYLNDVCQAGREFARGGISQHIKEKLNTLLLPKEVFEELADASWGIEKESGKKSDPSFGFTKQMATLYNKNSYTGKDRVLEINYTDIGKTYQIIMKRDGCDVIKENFKPFTTRIETPMEVWKKISSGDIFGPEALAKKLYRVEGDFDLMLNWDKNFCLGVEPNKENKASSAKAEKAPSMLLLMIPWITFFTIVPFSSYIGAFVSIGLCALLNLVFFRFRKTIYDVISSSGVTAISIGSLLFLDKSNLLLPVSYLAFGLMWCVSCLFKVPLTAWYSMKKYNSDVALKNPLFLSTNRILTLAWGLVYIATGIWNLCLVGSVTPVYTLVINNILPIFMGGLQNGFQSGIQRITLQNKIAIK